MKGLVAGLLVGLMIGLIAYATIVEEDLPASAPAAEAAVPEDYEPLRSDAEDACWDDWITSPENEYEHNVFEDCVREATGEPFEAPEFSFAKSSFPVGI